MTRRLFAPTWQPSAVLLVVQIVGLQVARYRASLAEPAENR
jgi:hypothetical protein